MDIPAVPWWFQTRRLFAAGRGSDEPQRGRHERDWYACHKRTAGKIRAGGNYKDFRQNIKGLCNTCLIYKERNVENCWCKLHVYCKLAEYKNTGKIYLIGVFPIWAAVAISIRERRRRRIKKTSDIRFHRQNGQRSSIVLPIFKKSYDSKFRDPI